MRLLDRPIAGYGYVHRGHAGSANPLPVGTHGRPRGRAAARASNVAVGEVMSSVGPGSARISSGPHAEIGLLRRRRIPLGPGIAARCESVLRSSYRTADPRRGARRIEPPTHAERRYAGIRALLAQLVEHFHGKEGVVGSSPTEGSAIPANGQIFVTVVIAYLISSGHRFGFCPRIRRKASQIERVSAFRAVGVCSHH